MVICCFVFLFSPSSAFGQDNALSQDQSGFEGNQLAPMNQEILPDAEGTVKEPGAIAEGDAAGDVIAPVPASPVEINGDKVEFLTDQQKVIAEGNVTIAKDNVKLFADRVDFDRTTNIAVAEGHVILEQGNARMIGDRMTFDYATMKGSFDHAKIDSHPFYGTGEKIEKVGDNHIVMKRGYFTTCDHDKPHFQMVSRKIDIYPGDKAVARHVRMLVGPTPLIYLPRYTQNISDKKPMVTFTPGYDKDWGAFLLSQWRYYFSPDFKGVVHLDYRDRKDFAWGIDSNYQTKKYGQGIIRTYYMNERSLAPKKHLWDERLVPTIERERFKAEWRHQWEIDKETNAIWQYSKLSDAQFIEDYFKRQHQEDTTSAGTYFLLTRALPAGILSFRTDKRVNRFESMIERMPEIRYDLASQKLGGSNFYLENLTTFSNFSKVLASPSEDRRETMRLHTDNEVSYPMKISFLELKPFVGGSQTYYSKTKDPSQYSVLRGTFRTGADLSTKFYRVFDVETDKFGLDINRLRHIITPSVAYQYLHEPTILSSVLDEFDEIDAKSGGHSIIFGLENKLQTKRKGKSVDLLRTSVSTDFLLKEHPGNIGGFNAITADVEVTPYRWLNYNLESRYSTRDRQLETVNMDLSLFGPGDKAYMSLGKRWNGRQDDTMVSEVGYIINSKWSLVVENQYDLDSGTMTLQEYSVKRDLHDWIMQVNFNETRGKGSEIWLVFTLKAFPEIGFDFGTGFNKRKAGTQYAP